MKEQPKSRAMERIAEKIIEQQVGLKPGRSLLTPMDYGECIRCVIDGLERSQEEITRLKAELESLKILKDATKKGSEIYANLRFDDEPFTPYQLALQEIEKLKAEMEKERELRNELVDSLHAILQYSRRWLDEYTNEIIQSLIERQKDL